jgi:hypothetical protein
VTGSFLLPFLMRICDGGRPSSTNRAHAFDRAPRRTPRTLLARRSLVPRRSVVRQSGHPQLHSTSSWGAGSGCVQARNPFRPQIVLTEWSTWL